MRVLEVCRVGSWVALSVVFSGLWMGNPAVWATVTVPNTLSVGDQYRWVFVTSSTHQATSSEISTYNTIVDDLGDNAIESDWKVIGSTPPRGEGDAILHTATPIATSGVSIWRVDGVKVADDYDDFWDGSLDAPINRTEHLLIPSGTQHVWTGTVKNGRSNRAWRLGYHTNLTLHGNRTFTDFNWTDDGVKHSANSFRLYGMSEVFTVPAANPVPEPSSAILLGVGVICVGWSRFRRKRRQASSTV